MRLLADENLPKPIVEMLRAAGHDVLWARADLAGAKDGVLLDIAEAETRLVLTLDKDFWQLAVQRRAPLERSGVILFRTAPAGDRTFDAPSLQRSPVPIAPRGSQPLRTARDPKPGACAAPSVPAEGQTAGGVEWRTAPRANL
jgi:hypothetical protein